MKYRLTEETKQIGSAILHRIECVEAFGTIQTGDKGGWIENEDNLSQEGNAWVSGNAEVYGDARVYGNAWVYGDAWVYGNAWVYGDARVSKTNGYMTIKNSWTSNRVFTYTRSNKKWSVGCFYGTGEELVAKAYKDSELSGMCYEATVEYVEKIYSIIENNKQQNDHEVVRIQRQH